MICPRQAAAYALVLFRRALLAAALWFTVPTPAAFAGDAPCARAIQHMGKPINAVQELGGLFVLFDQVPALSNHSALAIQLDSRMREFHNILSYLCDTLKGVPLNELAAYVTRKVDELGEEGFRSKQRVLGRSGKEIQLWIDYAKAAGEMKNRTLDASRLKKTLDESAPYFDRYLALALALESGKASPPLEQAQTLHRNVTAFLSESPYLALALQEKAQAPYWDFDENHGGS
jgi:hypothetical protein